MNYSINRCDLVMITIFIIILSVFGTYKYLHNVKPYDELDKKVDDILNKKDIIIPKKQKIETPKIFYIEDLRIPELLINNKSMTTLIEEGKDNPE